MAISNTTARKAAYTFLAICCGAVIAFAGFRIYQEMGPSKISVASVPFGVPAGTSVLAGDVPDMKAELSQLPAQTQADIRRAMDLFRSGSYQAAYELYEAVTLLYPDLAYAQWNEVNTLFAMDSLTELEQNRLNLLVGKLQGKFPGSGIALYLDSRRAYKAKNTAAALELAQKASEQAAALYETRLWYSKLLTENARVSQAVAEAKMAISLSAGNSAAAYDALAKLYHDQGLLDSCSAVVEYALSQYPVDAELLLLQGFLSEYKGHFDAAEKIYQRILAFLPDNAAAAQALATLGEKSPPGTGTGVALTPKDRSQVACDILEPLVEKYPENLPLREALGLAYLKGREFDLARAQFREIQTRDPEYPDIQQRIQESIATKPAVVRSEGLADDLNRAVDSLREAMEPATKHDFTTMLGHYLVRYGATPGEFFKKYAVGNFRSIKTNVWQESFYEPPYKHTYTVVFDSLNHFREVHVVVFDSSAKSNHMGVAPEIFSRLLKQNSRISGIGNNTGETDCGDGLIMDAAVWETQDNFEILARIVGQSAEVRMVRFDKNALPPGLKLCDYAQYLNEF